MFWYKSHNIGTEKRVLTVQISVTNFYYQYILFQHVVTLDALICSRNYQKINNFKINLIFKKREQRASGGVGHYFGKCNLTFYVIESMIKIVIKLTIPTS